MGLAERDGKGPHGACWLRPTGEGWLAGRQWDGDKSWVLFLLRHWGLFIPQTVPASQVNTRIKTDPNSNSMG